MAKKTARLLIEGEIGEGFSFWGEPSESFSSKSCREFLDNNKDADTIEVEIRSNGGSVTHGFDIYDQLKNSGKKIITVGYNVKSIATVIFLAGEVRKLSEHAEFLIHNPWVDPFMFGPMGADDLAALSESLKQDEDKIVNLYAQVTGQKAEDLSAKMQEDQCMSSADALALGFATEIMAGAKSLKATRALAYNATHANIIQANHKNMSKQNALVEKLDAFLAKFDVLLGGKSNKKNLDVKLKDGATVYVQTEEAEAKEGDAVFSDAEFATPATDGDYVTESGSTIAVKEGKIEAIKAAEEPNAEVEALKVEKAALETAKADAEAKATAAEAKAADLEKEVSNLKAGLLEVQNQVKDFRASAIKDDTKNTGGNSTPLTPAQEHLRRMREARGETV